jgi:hypothetical protein
MEEIKTPKFPDQVLGQLLVSCAGLPYVIRPCSKRYCEQRQIHSLRWITIFCRGRRRTEDDFSMLTHGWTTGKHHHFISGSGYGSVLSVSHGAETLMMYAVS